MKYKIIIEKKEPNPNFEAEYKQWDERARYGNRFPDESPQREIITNALIAELTEEEYRAIKAEVFTTFK